MAGVFGFKRAVWKQCAVHLQSTGTRLNCKSDSKALHIPRQSYGSRDAFVETHGTCHCRNTCNTRVGQGMAVAGVQVARLTPMARSVLLYLPVQQEPS
ncbi:MAG TPA: hypothetical protein DCG12_04795 [Planctomycetaceae bacterium]|nr:hypothetical protein [Planctomycetaceae bacterium]